MRQCRGEHAARTAGKLGVWVECSVRRILLQLPDSLAYRKDWLRIARSVGAVPA